MSQLAAARSYRLRGGCMTLHIEAGSWAPEELFCMASRRNPRRGFLFVSTVLGRHTPVAPSRMRVAFTALADRIPADLPGPILMLGMAETAVGLGAGVHQVFAAGRDDCLYLCSTRHPTGAPVLARFEEAHSHASSHLIHVPQAAKAQELLREARSLVIVDDEASTGNTAVNVVAALQSAPLPALEQVVLATLTDFSAGAVAEQLSLPCRQVNLLAGSWDWQANPAAEIPQMPKVNRVAQGSWAADPARDWGRLGVFEHVDPLHGAATAQPGRRTLLLGSGEYVWPPFLLAEQLEKAGEQVRYAATTRSPISLGASISRRDVFADNYGLGIQNFAYNCDPQDYDRVLICVETAANSVDPALLAALSAEVITEPMR